MRRILLGLLALVLLVAMAACGSIAREPAADADAADSPSWLLVLRAGAGTYAVDGATGTLVLRDVDPSYLAFTDRPARQARRGGVDALVAGWDAAFASSPPNAAISLDESGADGDMLVVTLGTPTLGPDGSLTFPAAPVPGADETWSTRVGRAPDRELPPSFGPVSLYVDNLSIDEIAIQMVIPDPASPPPPGS